MKRSERYRLRRIAISTFVAGEMLRIIQYNPAFVDTHLFDSVQAKLDGMSLLFDNMTAMLSKLVPVARISDKKQRRAIVKRRASAVGVGVRLGEAQFSKAKQLRQLLDDLATDETETDLILDLGAVEEERHDASSLADWIKRLCDREKPWRSVTLLVC